MRVQSGPHQVRGPGHPGRAARPDIDIRALLHAPRRRRQAKPVSGGFAVRRDHGHLPCRPDLVPLPPAVLRGIPAGNLTAPHLRNLERAGGIQAGHDICGKQGTRGRQNRRTAAIHRNHVRQYTRHELRQGRRNRRVHRLQPSVRGIRPQGEPRGRDRAH